MQLWSIKTGNFICLFINNILCVDHISATTLDSTVKITRFRLIPQYLPEFISDNNEVNKITVFEQEFCEEIGKLWRVINLTDDNRVISYNKQNKCISLQESNANVPQGPNFVSILPDTK